MSSNSISSDSKELEKALRDLDPAQLDADFLSRLEAAAEGDLTQLTISEIQFEKSLGVHRPHALGGDFLARLEAVVADVQFAVDEKIVLFPKTAPVIKRPSSSNRYSTWAAAAAVALIGGATALLMPGGNQSTSSSVARTAPVSRSAAPVSDQSNYVPAGFNSGIGDATDEGITWHQADRPHRVVKVTYLDKVTLKNAEGKTVEVERPRTEYIFVPEKMD